MIIPPEFASRIPSLPDIRSAEALLDDPMEKLTESVAGLKAANNLFIDDAREILQLALSRSHASSLGDDIDDLFEMLCEISEAAASLDCESSCTMCALLQFMCGKVM